MANRFLTGIDATRVALPLLHSNGWGSFGGRIPQH